MNKFTYSNVDTPNSQINALSIIDFCKGLAIIWIFLYHHQGGWFGWQGVHIFIVLSGFGLTYSCIQKNRLIVNKQWYFRRFEKILPAYWLVCISGLLIIVCVHLFQGKGVEFYLFRNFIIDLFLLRNFFHQSVYNEPNGPLWFVPFIFSFYLVFPYLYAQVYKNRNSILLILLSAVMAEFVYRGISLYFLDGCPIGTCDQVLETTAALSGPLNKLPVSFLFQLQAPFGFFPSRIAEFVLGMLGAIAFIQNKQKFNNIFSFWIGVVSIFIWLATNYLIYPGLGAWIFSDFLIAITLILWVVNLGFISQQKSPFLFSSLSKIGTYSYYIFLSHFLFIYVYNQILVEFIKTFTLSTLINKIIMLSFTIGGTSIASWLLMKFDNSKFPQVIMQKTLARFLT